MSHSSKVGYPQSYDDGDQHHYSKSDIHKEGRHHGKNTDAYMNKDKVVNDLYRSDIQDRIDDRMKHESGFAATMHGHKPSKGAQIDAEIAKEEAEMLAKKKEKTDSMTGKKLEESSCEQYPPA